MSIRKVHHLGQRGVGNVNPMKMGRCIVDWKGFMELKNGEL